jgi:hypothetical protein
VYSHTCHETICNKIHTPEPLVLDPSPFEVEITIAKLKRYKSPGSLRSIAHSLILFVIRKNCLISGRIVLLYQFTRRAIKLAVVIIVRYHCLSTSYRMLSNILPSRLSPYIDEISGDHQCGFRCNRSTTYQIFAFIRYWRKNMSSMRQYISYS